MSYVKRILLKKLTFEDAVKDGYDGSKILKLPHFSNSGINTVIKNSDDFEKWKNNFIEKYGDEGLLIIESDGYSADFYFVGNKKFEESNKRMY